MINFTATDPEIRASLEAGFKATEEENEVMREYMKATGNESNFQEKRSALCVVELKNIDTNYDYQRDLMDAKMRKMDKGFSPDKMEIKILNYSNDNRYQVIEGNHLIHELKEKGYPRAIFQVYVGLTVEEQAELFLTIDENRDNLKTADRFRAGLCANREIPAIANKVCKEFHLVTDKRLTVSTNAKLINSYRMMEKIVKRYGEEGMRFVLKTIERAGWANVPGAYAEVYLNIGFTAYPICKKDPDKYLTLISVMKASLPNEFLGYAKRHYSNNNCNHNERCLVSYVLDILGEYQGDSSVPIRGQF